MEDPDAQMQTEASSQAGSIAYSDRMELEGVDDALTSSALPDAEMEIHDNDIEAEQMKDALVEEDAEMAAEMEEQEMKTEHLSGWEDRDADIEVVDVEQANDKDDADEGEMKQSEEEETVTEDAKEAREMLQTGLEEGGVTEATEATKIGHSAEEDTTAANDGLEKGQLTLEDSITKNGGEDVAPQDKPEQADARNSQADEIEPVQYGVLNPEGEDTGSKTAPDEQKEVADVLKPTNETDGDDDEERYADVPVETNDPATENTPEAVTDTHATQRPSLQKDYLSHIDLFSSSPPSAPHVSLIYDNSSYSLFRASSSPSGDDEDLLFSSEEGGDHELYFGNLDMLVERLHDAFPGLRGDGENEIVLDFGILDMQISEDNIYIKQLSLYDIDRIRVGMSQPELDRLQVNLIVGKRFVYRFNELAEHCYRMYTGSEEDDSGTIQDYEEEDNEEDDPLQDYNEEELEVTAAEEGQVNPDYTTEENTQDLDQGELDKLQEQEREYEENAAENGQDGEEGKAEEDGAVDVGEHGEYEEELHPPSDEHYEDPEFSQEGIEDGNEAEEVNAGGAGEDDEAKAEVNGQSELEANEEEEKAGEALDLDAPLADAAEQAEEYEEAAFEEEEGAQAEGEADANTDNAVTLQDPAVSRPTHQPDRTEQEKQYFDSLDSLAGEEEIVLVEKPDPAPVLEEYAAELEDTRAAQVGDTSGLEDENEKEAKGDGVEELGKKITRSSSKRNREELLGDDGGAELDRTLPELDTNSGDPKRAKISVNI